MRTSAEEFLYILLWTADTLARPTWRNLNDGFEAWAWRNGLGRRLAELERQQFIERLPDIVPHAVVRLTNAGRLAAIGGRDPEEQWRRGWDGRWRMVLFDVPVSRQSLHIRLWRNLRRHGFGFLQNSVWITPDPVDRSRLAAASEIPSVEMIVVMEAQPCGGESNGAIVRGSWDFEDINAAYERYLRVLESFPRERTDFDVVRRWTEMERIAWADAVRRDPFLPASLLPRDYQGRRAWKCRMRILSGLGAAFGLTSGGLLSIRTSCKTM